MTQESRYVPIQEFVEFGYLQELNRQFLHPLGMALAWGFDDDAEIVLMGIQDHRSATDGMIFADLSDEESRTKERKVAAECDRRMSARMSSVGSWVQPMTKEEKPCPSTD